MKMKFNLDEELSLNKTIEITTVAIVVRAVFHWEKKETDIIHTFF